MWAHTSPASGLPGMRRTLELITGKYWWLFMTHNMNSYVASCSTCAQAKVPRNFLGGKLMPLETPQHPTYLITDLPESEENIMILVILDTYLTY